MANISLYSFFAILIKFTYLNDVNSKHIILSDSARNNSQYRYHETKIVPRDSSGRTKCLKEVPTILLEFDRRYTIFSKGEQDYYSKIAVCCDGYKLHPYEHDLCVPDCGDKCHNGFCVDLSIESSPIIDCKCFHGYVKNEKNECVLSCPIGCQNGHCKRDGKCECYPGYEMGPTLNYCVPKCEHCGQYQYCSEPNVCKCIEGYQLGRYGCSPICNPDCYLGECISPNICDCGNGLSNRICQNRCYQNCDNGRCIDTNRCVCNDKFVYDELTTTCIPDLESRKTYRIE